MNEKYFWISEYLEQKKIGIHNNVEFENFEYRSHIKNQTKKTVDDDVKKEICFFLLQKFLMKKSFFDEPKKKNINFILIFLCIISESMNFDIIFCSVESFLFVSSSFDKHKLSWYKSEKKNSAIIHYFDSILIIFFFSFSLDTFAEKNI